MCDRLVHGLDATDVHSFVHKCSIRIVPSFNDITSQHLHCCLSLCVDTSTGVKFIRPEDEELNKHPRKAWKQPAPVDNLFDDKPFEGVTHSMSREVSREDEDILATGTPLIPVVSEVSVSG